MRFTAIGVAATMLTIPAFAQDATGDAEAGEKVFNKCKSCHMIVADDGTEIQKGGKTGPNLHGIQRVKGSADFNYSKGLASLAEDGSEWDQESFTAYVADPSAYLTEATGEKQRGKMTYRLRDEEDAVNVWAYLTSVGAES